MPLDSASIRVTGQIKQRLDQLSDINGGIPQHRLIAALLNGWDVLDDDQRIVCIRNTARETEPATAA